jgi:peptidoglycan/LPS O-acetylase OafA/YrhL
MGATGVTLFFVLSGFLITTLLLQESEKRGRVGLGAFYIRRGLRLLPALFAMLLALIVYKTAWDHRFVSWTSIAGAVFYAENWLRVAGTDTGPLAHTWSLSVEEQFYLVWPLALVAVGATTLRRRRALLYIALSGAVLLTFERLIVGGPSNHLEYGTDTRGNALLLGCVTALLLRDGWRLRSRVIAPAVAVAVIALTALSQNMFVTVAALGACLLIAWLVSGDRKPRLLRAWPVRQTGVVSYGLYVWHFPIIAVLAPLLVGMSTFPRAVVLVAVSYAAAVSSYFVVERPFLRLKRNFASDAQPTTAVQAPLAAPAVAAAN